MIGTPFVPTPRIRTESGALKGKIQPAVARECDGGSGEALNFSLERISRAPCYRPFRRVGGGMTRWLLAGDKIQN